jgi:hypothetical protein
MSITVKLKYTEVMALDRCMDAVDLNARCKTRHEAINRCLMLRFHIMLKQKSIIMQTRDYRISVSHEMALAFVLFFTSHPVNHASHSGMIIQKLISVFDQQTANLFTC